jgi:hypothetical protein
MITKFIRHITLIALLVGTFAAKAQDNDDILNRPYADMQRIHFGFSVGANFMNLALTNNGYKTSAGETWYAAIPSNSPGFTVTVLGDLRLSQYFNLRLSPGMYFGNKVIKFHDTTNDGHDSQNIKTNYVVVPLDLKYSALRYKNMRPYLIGGVMATFDVSKKRNEQLVLTSNDVMLTCGFGCDFYLPFFKFCPEVKFCFGLKDLLDHKRTDLSDDPEMMKYTNSLSKVTSNMVVVSFYFE